MGKEMSPLTEENLEKHQNSKSFESGYDESHWRVFSASFLIAGSIILGVFTGGLVTIGLVASVSVLALFASFDKTSISIILLALAATLTVGLLTGGLGLVPVLLPMLIGAITTGIFGVGFGLALIGAGRYWLAAPQPSPRLTTNTEPPSPIGALLSSETTAATAKIESARLPRSESLASLFSQASTATTNTVFHECEDHEEGQNEEGQTVKLT